MTNKTVRSHSGAVRHDGSGDPAPATIPEQAAALKSLLGPKLMSLTMGVDPVTVDRWVAGRVTPRLDNEKRIRCAYQVYSMLKQVDSDPTIRAWFMGMNPQLDDRSPAEAIAEGDLRAVLAAARAFRAGG